MTCLMYAAAQGHKDTVNALLSKGVDVNAKSKHGETAIQSAKDGGHGEIVALLEKAGAK